MTKTALREFNKKIGYRIYLRRKILKLTQKNIADELNVSFQCIQNYETGKISLNVYNLYKIAVFLGVDISYFSQDINYPKNKVIYDATQNKQLQNMLKDFVNIKNKEVAKIINALISCLSDDN